VAEKYKRDVPRGLFGYLDQIRLAYITGADLPALALCRSTTELLIRRHYASDVPDALDSIKRPLIPLMKKVRVRLRDSSRLFKYVTIANDVLHSRMLDENVYDLPARYRALVRDWVRLLKDMIDGIPELSRACRRRRLRLYHALRRSSTRLSAYAARRLVCRRKPLKPTGASAGWSSAESKSSPKPAGA
jgi:hypothetical protein